MTALPRVPVIHPSGSGVRTMQHVSAFRHLMAPPFFPGDGMELCTSQTKDFAAAISLDAALPKIHGTSLMYQAADWIWKI